MAPMTCVLHNHPEFVSVVFFETGSCYVALRRGCLKLTILHLSHLSAGVIGVWHHAQMASNFKLNLPKSISCSPPTLN
jgi:hypothetical protein